MSRYKQIDPKTVEPNNVVLLRRGVNDTTASLHIVISCGNNFITAVRVSAGYHTCDSPSSFDTSDILLYMDTYVNYEISFRNNYPIKIQIIDRENFNKLFCSVILSNGVIEKNLISKKKLEDNSTKLNNLPVRGGVYWFVGDNSDYKDLVCVVGNLLVNSVWHVQLATIGNDGIVNDVPFTAEFERYRDKLEHAPEYESETRVRKRFDTLVRLDAQ